MYICTSTLQPLPLLSYPPPSHPTLYTSLQGSFSFFREFPHSIPFHYKSVRAKHSLPSTCAPVLAPCAQLRPTDSLYKKMYVYKLEAIGYSVQFLPQYSSAPAHSNTTPNTWPIGSQLPSY